jgi:prophage antirepressor-like protein
MKQTIEKISVKNITFPIKIQGENTMVNLSKMATSFKKRPIDWLRSKRAEIYTKCLSSVKNPTIAAPWIVIKNGTPDERGTWAHYWLAVYFAEWLNPEFSLQVQEALENLIKNLKVSYNDMPNSFTFPTTSQTIRIEIIDGEPWFVAKDVCDVLEHTNHRIAIQMLDDDEKGVRKVYTLGGVQEMNVVNESGLYNLIFRSNKPQAKAFRKWVTSEVLPAIRRTGAYCIPKKEKMPEREKHLSNIMYDVCFIEDTNLRTRIAEQLKYLVL